METGISPTPADLERYLRLRRISRTLSDEILKTAPKEAWDDIGGVLGLHRGGGEMNHVVADCCLYDWYRDGKNVVRRYAEMHPAKPETDEQYLLKAYLNAKYRLLEVQRVAPGAGIDCHDLLNHEAVFVMDVDLGRTAETGSAMATRTVPLGEYWMTSGAAIPVTSREAVKNAFNRIEKGPRRGRFQGADSVSILMVRACLDANGSSRGDMGRREASHFGRKRRRRG